MRSSDSHTSGTQLPMNRSKSLVRGLSRRFVGSFDLQPHPAPHFPHQNTYVVGLSLHIDRKKVLKHHPDKKATIAGETNDDAFFKCIQKAMDVLTNPERRRQFDSVDPHYQSLEDDVPTASQLKGKDYNAFFKGFNPVFEREARFSKEKPVPLLGAIDAPKKDVEGFYDFWYNFDSWRSFEYLDKEINEGSDKSVPVYFSQAPWILTPDTPAETISGIRRRRIKPSELAGRRRTQPGYAASWTFVSVSTLASRGLNRKRKKPGMLKRGARPEPPKT